MIKLAAILCLAPLLATASAHALQLAPSEEQLKLDREVPNLLAEKKVSSLSVARIENGKLLFTAAYGNQSPNTPATPATLYNIASLTKPITAELILRLASARRISLDEPMYRNWTDPDIAQDPRTKLLTPRLALSHQTGFPNWRSATGGHLQFLFTPGQGFGYSGEGFEYMARFAESRTATPLDRLASQLLFTPAHMTSTFYAVPPALTSRIALPTDAQGNFLKPVFADKPMASDLLYTTPTDYASFLLSLLHPEGKPPVVSPALAKDRASIQVDRKAEECAGPKSYGCPDSVGFGLGWEVMNFANQTILMHTGMDTGVFTLAYVNLATNSATILFTNSANGPQIVVPILELLNQDPAFVQYLIGQTR